MSISHFAEKVDLSICEYIDHIPFSKANQNKKPIYFLKGDPSTYNNKDFQIQQAAFQAMKKQFQIPTNHGYTLSHGVPPAREAILTLYHPKFPLTINEVVIQHGVNQGLLCSIMSFTNPGDQILVPEIGYPIFQKLGPALRVNVKAYKFKGNDYQIDLDSVKALITQKTQFIFIINPMNPTGTVFSLQHMKQILKFCDQNQLPILADQVYHGQTYPDQKFISFGDITQDVPVIVTSGIQKMFMTPGWCTSWSIIFDKHHYLQTVWRNIVTCGMTFLHSNKPTQMALPELIQKQLYLKPSSFKETQQNQAYLNEQFSKYQCFKPVRAKGTIYQLILLSVDEFKDIKNDREFCQKLLIQQNICILPLSAIGGNKDGFRMITCANKQLYEQMFVRINIFVEKHKK